MKTLTASALITLLENHIHNHGDGKVMVFDDYNAIYKTISVKNLSRNQDRFVIECEREEDSI